MASAVKPNHYWSDDETAFMLAQLKDQDILRFLDGRKRRNGEVFRRVAVELSSAGFIRTAEQVRVRWKHIKRMYYASKRKDGTSSVWSPHQEILDELLGRGGDYSMSQMMDNNNGIDVGFETPAIQPQSESPSPSPSGTPPESDALSRNPSNRTAGRLCLPCCCLFSPPRVLPPRDTSTPHISVQLPTSRRRQGTISMDAFFNRMEVMHRENAARQEAYMERLERRYQENREALMAIAHSHQQMVVLMSQFLRPPSAPQQQSTASPEGRSQSPSPQREASADSVKCEGRAPFMRSFPLNLDTSSSLPRTVNVKDEPFLAPCSEENSTDPSLSPDIVRTKV
ncbi:hypothetical protein WMY93_008617 [Mugilogobius chulae]|uniref:Myb/SANT-like DNA-binding domain-containing protein n=1 Tax=Mugilogobius chulae TaxID=88201 RepID=A0AAW0PL86_9GOBI